MLRCKVVQVSGEAYIALRITIEIQLNYPADDATSMNSLQRGTGIYFAIQDVQWARSSIHLAKLRYPPPTGGRMARLQPSFKAVSKPCISATFRPSIRNCT